MADKKLISNLLVEKLDLLQQLFLMSPSHY
jgi:hypothetical protein